MGKTVGAELTDRFWLWSHQEGAQNVGWGLPRPTRITPTEAAHYLRIPNILMVVYGGKPQPPFDQHALAMSSLKRVVWSIVGDSSSKRNDEKTDLDEVLRLAAKFPNVTGAIMDDFFHALDASGRAARWRVADLAGFRERLHAGPRPLDLWVVLYTHQLDLPVRGHLRECDIATLWTWKAADLVNLEESFGRFEDVSLGVRKVLGCYLWDYGTRQPMPLELFQHQVRLGVEWLRQGRIEGIIFLASCVCDLELDTVEWLRREVSDEIPS